MNSGLLHVGDTMGPDEVNIPKSPDDSVDPDTNTEKGDPTFEKVGKPGKWSSFSYRLLFTSIAQGGQYNKMFLPGVYQLVSPNEDDAEISTHGGWNVFYQVCKKGEDEYVVGEIISKEYPPPWVDV